MPKLVYSLILWPDGRPLDSGIILSSGAFTTPTIHFEVMFQVHQMDTRFRGQSYDTPSGWRIRSDTCPQLDSRTNTIYLHGARPRDFELRETWFAIVCGSVEEARDKIREIHAALAEWAENCPCFFDSATGEPQSEEVRESLLMAEDEDEQPEEEDVDAPPPIDEFVPNRISI